jgi:hypothetical protein
LASSLVQYILRVVLGLQGRADDAVIGHQPLELVAGVLGGFKRSSQRQMCSFTAAFVKLLCRRFPAQGLSQSGIEGRCHGGDLIGATNAQVRTFREVLTPSCSPDPEARQPAIAEKRVAFLFSS